MKSVSKVTGEKVLLLKQARLKLLQLHKLFVDAERNNYENQNGQVSSGQFLNLLVNDANFQWLRRFSILIVEIDEMFDLDDGFTENLIEKYLSQIHSLVNFELADTEFEARYVKFMQDNIEIAAKHEELKKSLLEG